MDGHEPTKEGAKEEPEKSNVDEDFNPPVEMMVHDYDDEHTLEEEEALGPLEDPKEEISNLEKEGNMPLEDLMAMYGYDNASDETKSTKSEDSDQKEPSELEQLYNDEVNVRPTRFPTNPQTQSDGEDSDGPGEGPRKKSIMVGSDFQAVIPSGLCKYGDALPYENEDKLVWDPKDMDPEDLKDFLIKATKAQRDPGMGSIPMGNHLRDDENALYVLLQCRHDTKEALRRLQLNTPEEGEPETPLWSEEECKNFEAGLRIYGKDFHQIHLNKVKTRPVGELVQFYYLWKKTERHDIFANKARLVKKKYSLHPGVTDYMERFLEGDEKQRTDSPAIHSLMYSDQKWKPTVEEESTVERKPIIKEEKTE